MRLTNPAVFLLAASLPAAADSFSKLPLNFEANQGQTDARVQFLSRGEGHTLFLTSTEAVLRTEHGVFRMRLEGANPDSKALGAEPRIARSNYFIGNDPAKWRTGVTNYGRVRFTEVYPGIDLVYYGKDRQLEYDWIVKPGANPSKIRLKFAGVQKMRVDGNGDLVLATPSGEIRQKKPVVYQERQIAGRYVMRGRREAGFEVGPYNTAKALVIDPVLVYSSFLGGSAIDQGNAIAVDSFGNAYVTGWTNSTNFPTVNPPQSVNKGNSDVFVSKISADGSTLLYSTYLGGSSDDYGTGIALDSAGDAFVTGWTASSDFPLANAYQSTHPIFSIGFITKLNPAGNALSFSTFFGGNYSARPDGIAVDTSGNPYITGVTSSSDFPTTVNAIQGGPNPHGASHTFVTKMSADGSTLLYSTYLSAPDVADGTLGVSIAVDPNNNAYLTGWTASHSFPTFNALQPTFTGSQGIFVTKINSSGSTFIYSTFLNGSSGSDQANAIAADASGNAYITGSVHSADFPTVNPLQAHLMTGPNPTGFVTKINATGSAILYSTYLGGTGLEVGFGIAVDGTGEAWVAGMTESLNFPTVNPLTGTKYVAPDSLFVSKLSANGSALLFSSYVGFLVTFQGKPTAPGGGIALDSQGNAYVTGGTQSPFPIVNAFQPTFGGIQDAFVLKISAGSNGIAFNDFADNGRSGALLYDPSNGQSYTALSSGNGSYAYIGNLFTPAFDTLRTGDFNGDHKTDLIVYNSHNALAYIGMGNGDGTFAFQSLFWSPGYDTVETGDLNGDGKTDVALYNSSVGTMYTGISNGTGGFTYKYTLISPGFTFVRLADFNGDRKADLFLYRAADGQAFLGIGDGAGGFAFSPLSISPGYNLADTGDLNGDGKADVILYNPVNGNAATGLSIGSGFAFTPFLFSPGFTSVRLADYTGDGKADLTVYNKVNAAAYFGTGTGTGTFNFQSLFWSPGYDYVVPEDVNGDRKADVVLYNSATGTEYTGISNGNGTFNYTYQYWGIGKVLAR